MRIRIALTLGALVLAGGALTGGIALASEAQAPTAPCRSPLGRGLRLGVARQIPLVPMQMGGDV